MKEVEKNHLNELMPQQGLLGLFLASFFPRMGGRIALIPGVRPAE